MSDRRVVRSKTRASRRPVACHSCEDDETDTSASDQNNGSPVPVRHVGNRCRGGYCSDSAAAYGHTTQRLPPIGVYWDIENCQIPRGKSAVAVAQAIRDQFFSGYRETEFVVVCDVKRESPQVIQDLENAQVNVIHVGSQSKNAADEKLRQSIRRFADTHGSVGSFAAIVLISGDINFAPDLCDLRHRQKIHVILVHNDNCSESLMMCASETYSYSALVAGLPMRGAVKAVQPAEVVVSGLPIGFDANRVRLRLKRLSENCGGRVGPVNGTQATVRFPSLEFGIRAQKRMDGEDVYGSTIAVTYPLEVDGQKPTDDFSPVKSSRKPFLNGTKSDDRRGLSMTWDPSSFFKPLPPFNNGTNGVGDRKFKKPFPVANLFNQENIPYSGNVKVIEQTKENVQKKQAMRCYGGRPILGRHGKSFSCDTRPNGGYSNGRHSVDSIEADKGEENATFENWLRNSMSNLDSDKRNPLAASVVNTSIPPPPIVNLPRRNDRFFHPIGTGNQFINGNSQSSPSPASSSDAGETARCQVHSRVQSMDSSLINVTVGLSDFSARLMALVTAHNNRLPLPSLRDCYEAQFGGMLSDHRSITLEHLVTCVRSVELVKAPGGKYLRLTTNISPTFSPPQTAQDAALIQFSKDIQTLLINQTNCQLPFHQVIAVYNRVFGRSCRMSDYGCSKLIQLLEKLPDIIQVMGEGAVRVVTLTHRAQMQRFTSDLTKVLQSIPSKRIKLTELPQPWLTTLGQTLEPTNYGLCFLEDLLKLVPTSCAVVSGDTVSLPHSSSQTPAQILRTTQFGLQVVELLSTVGSFKMEFSKFCPAYHHHFGVQCKLSDYGFSKLMDLFEAIPDIVVVEGEETRRWVSLTIPERLKVLAVRVLHLAQKRFPPGLTLDTLMCSYIWEFKHLLQPEIYGCSQVLELMKKLPTVKVITNAEGDPVVVPNDIEVEKTGNKKLSIQPKLNKEEVVAAVHNTKVNGTVSDLACESALLKSVKKLQETSAIENGTNGTQMLNHSKSWSTPEPEITLLPPEEFLKPPSKSLVSRGSYPSSPDPSAVPKPVALAYCQVNHLLELGCVLMDLDSNEQKCKQRVKLAPQFCPPLQHN